MKLNKSDLNDWLEETKDVKKLKKDSKPEGIGSSYSVNYSKIEKQQRNSEAVFHAVMLSDDIIIKSSNQNFNTKKALSAQDSISSKRTSIDYKTLSRLKQGKIKYQDQIDLHGMFLEEAKRELALFLNNSYSKRLRCVLITHGKGGQNKSGIGKIKKQIPFWLEQFDFVLSFASAIPQHGGTGALYILLKTK